MQGMEMEDLKTHWIFLGKPFCLYQMASESPHHHHSQWHQFLLQQKALKISLCSEANTSIFKNMNMNQATAWKLFLPPPFNKISYDGIHMVESWVVFVRKEGVFRRTACIMGSNTHMGWWLLQLDISPLAPHCTPREKEGHFIPHFPTAVFLECSCGDHGTFLRDET